MFHRKLATKGKKGIKEEFQCLQKGLLGNHQLVQKHFDILKEEKRLQEENLANPEVWRESRRGVRVMYAKIVHIKRRTAVAEKSLAFAVTTGLTKSVKKVKVSYDTLFVMR